VDKVRFEYWEDLNGNGLADETGSITWTHAITASLVPGTLSEWTETWDNTHLYKGSYLLRVVAIDNDGNVRESTDPDNLGGVITLSSNTCGINPPSVRKAVTPTTVVAGEVVTFTIELSNTLTSSFEVSRITDTLPSGFTFGGRLDGTDTLTTETTGPNVGDTGTLVWTFDPADTVPAGESRTLIYTTTATSVVGTYANQATAQTTADTLNLGW
jgi:uncharacterized repeat protein (TIGR01451 family)